MISTGVEVERTVRKQWRLTTSGKESFTGTAGELRKALDMATVQFVKDHQGEAIYASDGNISVTVNDGVIVLSYQVTDGQ